MPRAKARELAGATGPDLDSWRRNADASGRPVRPGPPYTLRELAEAAGRDYSYLSQIERADGYAGEKFLNDLARAYTFLTGEPVSVETMRAAYTVTLRHAKRRKSGMFAPPKAPTPDQRAALDLLRAGQTAVQVAARLGIVPSTVRRWGRQWRIDGTL